MQNILVVDDETGIRSIIRKYAEFEGYRVTECDDGMEAVNTVRSGGVDIVVMDIMMPELDGLSAVREIRKFSQIPIIVLSARGEEYDKINGFHLGIDDYVVKPFSPKELLLRIEAVLRRTVKPTGEKQEHKTVSFDGGNLKADLTARIVYIDGERVEMSPKEYDLFFYLIANRGIALTREKLITDVWGYDFYGDARTLDTHVKLLRRSLGRYADCIVTLRGTGYRFEGKE